MSFFKETIIRNPSWMKLQHDLPCDICGEIGSTVGAHQRLLGNGGTSLKPGDDCTIPLCNQHHQEEHKGWNTFYLRMMEHWPMFLKRCLLARAREIYRENFADQGESILLDALKEYRKLSEGPGGAMANEAISRFQELHPNKNLWHRPKE